jgi:hypothetical protein
LKNKIVAIIHRADPVDVLNSTESGLKIQKADEALIRGSLKSLIGSSIKDEFIKQTRREFPKHRQVRNFITIR